MDLIDLILVWEFLESTNLLNGLVFLKEDKFSHKLNTFRDLCIILDDLLTNIEPFFIGKENIVPLSMGSSSCAQLRHINLSIIHHIKDIFFFSFLILLFSAFPILFFLIIVTFKALSCSLLFPTLLLVFLFFKIPSLILAYPFIL